ncbi:MAG: anhydro-N-acetylmuramic acid kinase, partial [Gemmatimonadaceae bacterium]
MTVVVGLMSGTSLDGISAAAVRFTVEGDRISADLLAYDVVAYDDDQRERLARALREGSPDEYCRLNFDLGHVLARAALRVMNECGVARDDIAAIASHGQTIWHVPGHSTWQLGEAAVIAERTSRPVISDFRVRDMAAGGQGAPLVPMADALLFGAAGHWRALQNLGGIGNVTVVPPNAGLLASRTPAGDAPAPLSGVRAFDTGPGVVIIDGVTRALVPALRFDRDGELAARGQAINAVVQEALEDPYFAAPPPKSTGRELFSPAYIARFISRCRDASPAARTEDMVATAVSLTAATIADAYGRFLPEPAEEVVLSGGGAKNPALVRAIAQALPGRKVLRFDDIFFDGEAKEAVAFALLGYLHLTGAPGNVPG